MAFIPVGWSDGQVLESPRVSAITRMMRWLVPVLSALWVKGRYKVRDDWKRFRPHLATCVAAFLFTMAGFLLATVAGLLVAGFMALLVDWKVSG